MRLDAAKLIDARHRKGLNQSEVAEACGVSLMTVFNAEQGKSVYPSTGKKICDFLGLDLADVVLSVSEEGDGDAA